MKTHSIRKKAWVWLLALFLVGIANASLLPFWQPAYWHNQRRLDELNVQIRQRGEAVKFSGLEVQDDESYLLGDATLRLLNQIDKPQDSFYSIIEADKLPIPNKYPILEDAVATNRRTLDELAAIETPGTCRFRYDFEIPSPYSTQLKAISGLRNAKSLRSAEFIQAIGNADQDRAVRAVVELCDTEALLRLEPFLVSRSFQATIGNRAIDCIAMLIGHVKLTPIQTEAIDGRLAEMEGCFRLKPTLLAERACLFTTMNNIGHPDVGEYLASCGGLDTDGRFFLFSSSSKIDRWSSISYQTQLHGRADLDAREHDLAG